MKFPYDICYNYTFFLRKQFDINCIVIFILPSPGVRNSGGAENKRGSNITTWNLLGS